MGTRLSSHEITEVAQRCQFEDQYRVLFAYSIPNFSGERRKEKEDDKK